MLVRCQGPVAPEMLGATPGLQKAAGAIFPVDGYLGPVEPEYRAGDPSAGRARASEAGASGPVEL